MGVWEQLSVIRRQGCCRGRASSRCDLLHNSRISWTKARNIWIGSHMPCMCSFRRPPVYIEEASSRAIVYMYTQCEGPISVTLQTALSISLFPLPTHCRLSWRLSGRLHLPPTCISSCPLQWMCRPQGLCPPQSHECQLADQCASPVLGRIQQIF